MSLGVSNIRASGNLIPSGTFTIQNPTITVGRIEPVGVDANATYQVVPRATSVNEGSSVTFDISTTNVPTGTTLYWSIFGGPNVTAADFTISSGSFVITSDAGIVTVGIVDDYITEGTEFFYLEVRTNSTSGNIVGTSRSVFINDTTFTFFFEITGNNTDGTNLRSRAITAGWDGVQRLECQTRFDARCIGSGASIATYNRTDNPVKHRDVAGLVIEGSFPNGLILRNNGTIAGRGGIGGLAGAGRNSGGTQGGAGGPGLVVVSGTTASFITVINQGRIAAGGGGGGGGAGFADASRGGGGGGGIPLGPGGVAGGSAANFLVRGVGGNPDNGYSQGGVGGQWGESGLPGREARPGGSGSGGTGGQGGIGIIGTNSITSLTTGNLSGGVLGTPGAA
jgi:hypothetical protein